MSNSPGQSAAQEPVACNPPIVDLLSFDPQSRSYSVTFVPEDRVSSSEKESVLIPQASAGGVAIGRCLDEIGAFLGGGRISRIVHSGGDDFAIWLESGQQHSLAQLASKSPDRQRLYEAVQNISIQAQAAFQLERQRWTHPGRASA